MRILFITCLSCCSFQGLSIAGGKGAAANRIFVVDVKPGGPAERNGKIQQADEILEVNEISIRGLTHYKASAILKVSQSVKLGPVNSLPVDEKAPFFNNLRGSRVLKNLRPFYTFLLLFIYKRVFLFETRTQKWKLGL